MSEDYYHSADIETINDCDVDGIASWAYGCYPWISDKGAMVRTTDIDHAFMAALRYHNCVPFILRSRDVTPLEDVSILPYFRAHGPRFISIVGTRVYRMMDGSAVLVQEKYAAILEDIWGINLRWAISCDAQDSLMVFAFRDDMPVGAVKPLNVAGSSNGRIAADRVPAMLAAIETLSDVMPVGQP